MTMLRKGDVITSASWLWHKLELPRNLSIPRWYSNYFGTSPWYTTKAFRSGDRNGRKARGLAFIIRMNYLMDTNLNSVRLRLPIVYEKFLNFFGGSFTELLRVSNVTWAHSASHNWQKVLSCTLRRFVNLTYPLLGARFRGVSSHGCVPSG